MLSKLAVKCNVLCETLLEDASRDSKKQKSCTELYLELTELKKYIFLNAEGVRKVVKKFDKMNNSTYLNNFINSNRIIQTILSEQKIIDRKMDTLVTTFAKVFTDGDVESGTNVLNRSVLDVYEWEKGTIWNDLMRLEHNRGRMGRLQLLSTQNGGGGGEAAIGQRRKSITEFPTGPGIMESVFSFYGISNFLILLISGWLYLYGLPSLPFHANRCLSVLVLVSGWWSLGTFPLFVSALAVPLLIVACDVLPVQSRADSARLVLSHMWGGSQAMVLASFALAAALSKLSLDKQLAVFIMSVVQSGRRKIQFALMVIGWALSFAVGNMAASVLCLSLAAPVLEELPQLDPTTADYGRRLLISIAFACNYGGMTSPVASPQNIVAFASLNPFGLSFAQWVSVAVPTSFILLVITFLFLMPPSPDTAATKPAIELPLLDVDSDDISFSELPGRLQESVKRQFVWDWRRRSVLGLTLFAAALWMASSLTVAAFGDVGLASLLPLLLLFALPGVLNKSDFLSMPWDVCLLLASGGVLSAAVSQSQLLSIAGQSASSLLSGSDPTLCLLVCCVFVTFVSTCVSHTAAANVLMPFIVELGASELGRSSAVRFILPVSLCLSAGMALPISSCPNMNATAMSRASNESQPWVQPTDYLRPGLILSVACIVVFVVITDPLTAYFCT
jgi:phosphate transporter